MKIILSNVTCKNLQKTAETLFLPRGGYMAVVKTAKGNKVLLMEDKHGRWYAAEPGMGLIPLPEWVEHPKPWGIDKILNNPPHPFLHDVEEVHICTSSEGLAAAISG